MHARVITFPGNHVKEVVEFLNNLDEKGFEEVKGSYVLADPNNEKTMTVTLWETREALEASMPAAEKVAKQIAKDITGMPPKIEVYEVAHQS